MRRVLLTVHKFFPEHRAGTEVLTLKVAQELQARGYEVLVLTADPPDTDARHKTGEPVRTFTFEGVKVVVFGESLRLAEYNFSSEYRHAAMRAEFQHVLFDFAPQLIHAFHLQNLSASIIEAAWDNGLPSVLSATDFWMVCPIVQLKKPDGGLCRGPSPGAANCLSCYTPRLLPPKGEFIEALSNKYPSAARRIESAGLLKPAAESLLHLAYLGSKLPAAAAATIRRPDYLRHVAGKLQAIMVPTRLMRDIFIENGIPGELLRHVPFGIDTEPLLQFTDKSPSATLRIGFIGTIFEHKGPDLLIQAFHKLPAGADARLMIYGDPDQFADFGQKVKDMAARGRNAGKIQFLGTFPNSELGPVLRDLDVLVVPSRWYENTPLVIQSALATKTPLIVADLGGMAELVRHGHNGLVFAPGDVNSLHEQLSRIIADRQLLDTLRNNIAPERTIKQMVDNIEEVYGEVLPSQEARYRQHNSLVGTP